MKRRILIPTIVGAFTLAIVSCDSDGPTTPQVLDEGPSFSLVDGADIDAAIREVMAEMNIRLEADGQDFRVEVVDWLAAPGTEMEGRTVYFKDVGPVRLLPDWVPGDPGRGGRTDINYAQDLTEAGTSSGLAPGQTVPAVDRAMATWDQETCATIPFTNLGVAPFDLGYVQYLLGFGGVPGWLADYTHAGWLPWLFFETIGGPGGGDNILGVTFTFVWVDGDLDNNGRLDVAFRETYYNDSFSWQIDGNIDVESVVLHEAGHGLSQGHFGTAFRTDTNGLLHFAPRAVMNAAYAGVQQSLLGSDVAGHCSNWSSWPEY